MKMRRILNCYVGGKGGALSLSCSLGLSVDRWIGDAGDAGERFCAGLGYAPGVRAGRAMRYFVRCRAQRRRKDRGMGAHRGRGSCLIKGTSRVTWRIRYIWPGNHLTLLLEHHVW